MPDARGPLPIIGVSAVILGEPAPGTVPVIAVDTSGHPDLACLRREIERTQQLVTHTLWSPTLQRPKVTLLLSVTVRAPIVCGFRLRFALPESRELLRSLSSAGRVILTVAPLGRAALLPTRPRSQSSSQTLTTSSRPRSRRLTAGLRA
jgi:hypothetical protein